jgi:uncharacterized SAM-binding protein YcdF (DUF218 family)
MVNVLLFGWIGLFVLAGVGFLRNRTALRNVVVLFVGIGVFFLWGGLSVDSSLFFALFVFLVILPIVFSLPILTLALLANGLVMYRREARTLGNLLSLVVGLVIVAMTWTMNGIFGSGYVNLYLGWGWISVAMVLGYFAVAFVVYLVASWLYSVVPTRIVPDYGIVLGARLIDGKVPPLLRSRLDRAIDLYRESEAQGRTLTLIPSGGQGEDEVKPEGVGMAEYLYANNIPREHVIVEDKAINTRGNMTMSRELMSRPDAPTAIITNNYHVFRAALLARKLGMKAHVYGAKTKFYYLPSAIIREFLAIMVQYKWLNLLVVLVVLAVGMVGLVESARAN